MCIYFRGEEVGFERNKYNQIANYVYMQQEINIKVGNKAPDTYLSLLIENFTNNKNKFSGIENHEELIKNFEMHCIPRSIINSKFSDYEDFLHERRKLMALKIKDYYFSL